MSWKKVSKNKYKLDVERQIDGQRKRKTKTITTALKGRDLHRFLKLKEDELYEFLSADEAIKDYSDVTYPEFVQIFMDDLDVEPRTIHYYKDYLLNRTMDYFKPMRITDIKRAHVIDFIKGLQKTISRATGKPLSPKTIKHHRDALRALLNYAKYLDIIDKNPADGIKIEAVPTQVFGRYYEPDEVENILSALQEHGDFRYYVFFVLQLYTGCRPSEIYGLMWNKIDFEHERITIDQALVKSHEAEGYVLKPTKTEDRRVKPLPGSLVILLGQLKELSLGVTDYVFTNAQGDHLGEGSFREYLRYFCKKHELKYLSPYAIRHTTGTLLSANGIPMANIASQLGHASTQTTSKYVHATRSMDEEAAEILSEIIRPQLRSVK